MGEMLINAVGFLWYGVILWGVIHTITHWEGTSEDAKKIRAENRKISEQAKDLYNNKKFCKEMAEFGREYAKKCYEKNQRELGD